MYNHEYETIYTIWIISDARYIVVRTIVLFEWESSRPVIGKTLFSAVEGAVESVPISYWQYEFHSKGFDIYNFQAPFVSD